MGKIKQSLRLIVLLALVGCSNKYTIGTCITLENFNAFQFLIINTDNNVYTTVGYNRPSYFADGSIFGKYNNFYYDTFEIQKDSIELYGIVDCPKDFYITNDLTLELKEKNLLNDFLNAVKGMKK